MKEDLRRHKPSKSEQCQMDLGLQSRSQIMMRSGMRINTVAQTMQHINKRRVKSYQKLSFNIRKMNDLFKPKQNNPEVQASKMAIVQPTQGLNTQQSLIAKDQKRKTCINFFESIKLKKNMKTEQGSLEKEKRALRIKTEHFEDSPDKINRKQSFFNIAMLSQQPLILPITVSLLKSSAQEDEAIASKGIPGIQFKGTNTSPLKASNGMTTKDTTKSIQKSMDKLSALTKNSNYLHAEELFERDNDRRIEQMYDLRREQQLFEEPKQWQFYNCLKLSQLSLYRSNLKLSCENWALLDYLELKYVRGWHPKEQKEIRVATTLFIAYIITNLQSSGLDCQRLKVRISRSTVEKKLPINYHCLENSTILSLWDLFIGVVYTNETDLIWHMIYVLAYLHRGYNVYVEGWSANISEYSKYIYIQETSELREFEKIFITLCQDICNQLKLTSFQIENKTRKNMSKKKQHFGLPVKSIEYILIKGSCVQLSILFMQCIKSQSFLNVFTNPIPTITIKIKYQVGNYFWEDRTHKWIRNGATKNQSFVLMDQNRENLQFSAVSYNTKQNVIAIINDSKTNMVLCDFESMFKWMRASVRRFQRLQNKSKMI